MTHAARSSTQALAVIVTFGKWVKVALCINVIYRTEKKCRKQHTMLCLLSLKLDTAFDRVVYKDIYTSAAIIMK